MEAAGERAAVDAARQRRRASSASTGAGSMTPSSPTPEAHRPRASGARRGQRLELDRSLRLVAHLVADVQQRGDRVEQAAGARRRHDPDIRSDLPARRSRADRLRPRGPARHRSSSVETPHAVSIGDRHAPRVANRAVPARERQLARGGPRGEAVVVGDEHLAAPDRRPAAERASRSRCRRRRSPMIGSEPSSPCSAISDATWAW